MKTTSRKRPDQTGLEDIREAIAAIRDKAPDITAYISRRTLKRTAYAIMKKSYTTYQTKKL